MKKTALLFLICTIVFSCKKKQNTAYSISVGLKDFYTKEALSNKMVNLYMARENQGVWTSVIIKSQYSDINGECVFIDLPVPEGADRYAVQAMQSENYSSSAFVYPSLNSSFNLEMYPLVTKQVIINRPQNALKIEILLGLNLYTHKIISDTIGTNKFPLKFVPDNVNTMLVFCTYSTSYSDTMLTFKPSRGDTSTITINL